MKHLILTITLVSLLLIMGCTEIKEGDEFEEFKAVAWEFVNEKGWNQMAKEEWQNATVTEIVVDENYELLDPSFEDKEVLSVSFQDKEDAVVGTPSILVDLITKEVVGYMLSE
ncbi:hypothetical protein M3649_09010 [Ureibacillus chungkukjangi]|uniref:hypothetical protein n=1 Tax=Ureibacillus chungkukjangi TaxID=1202712 RepID=UPI00203AAC48|nr:hypothetical protein [Ureibacillus chungkukjangi]MCM3388271.1 hypothetical protein [Ureibacillus chungkukjangi]